MRKITKYNKKIRLAYIASALAVCISMIIAFPWFRQIEGAEEDRDQIQNQPKFTYYAAILNGEEVGVSDSQAMIEKAFLDARLKRNSESSSLTYMDAELDIVKREGERTEFPNKEQLESKMYALLGDSVLPVQKQAYIVNIDGFTVTLDSKEAVVEVFNSVKSKYDKKQEFQVNLTENQKGSFNTIGFKMVKADTKANESQKVQASQDKSSKKKQSKKEDNKKQKDGVIGISFDQNVEIVEAYVDVSQIISAADAADLITKEKDKNQVYVVEEGNSLFRIARRFGLTVDRLLEMNPGVTDESFIDIGDEIVVTVPEPELSVVVKKSATYEEEYEEDVVYIENDNMYTTYSKVHEEGSSGYREVVAVVTYKNGNETGRKIKDESIKKKAKAKVVEVGTLTPPTFIRPLVGGIFTSGYGPRWGTIHKGVDWACNTGTAIKASCAGTVTSTGWRNGYGYSVDVVHADGKSTRYAHLSSILVSPGQKVAQGEKIALSGNTGNSTGPHLHFEIHVNGVQVNPLDYLE